LFDDPVPQMISESSYALIKAEGYQRKRLTLIEKQRFAKLQFS